MITPPHPRPGTGEMTKACSILIPQCRSRAVSISAGAQELVD